MGIRLGTELRDRGGRSGNRSEPGLGVCSVVVASARRALALLQQQLLVTCESAAQTQGGHCHLGPIPVEVVVPKLCVRDV